ncbi:MAG: hypothetical protein CW338_00560 [Clostridiales bacterium]|nr:hypothetical protein [Clostridiales bacterium]
MTRRGGGDPVKDILKKMLILLLVMAVLPVCAPAEETAVPPQEAASAPAEEIEVTDEEVNAFFSRALFIGDSVTSQLRVRIKEIQKKDKSFMKGCRYSTAQSYMLYNGSRKNASSNNVNLTLGGEELPLWKCVKKAGADYVFILLGLNDYVGEKIEKGIGWVDRIIDLCLEGSPDTKLVFMSLTPVTRSFCRKKDYRTMWDNYNAALKAKCEERGVYYLDIATSLKDEDGYLPKKYTSDGRCHLSSDGLDIWLGVLQDFARDRIREERAAQ